MVRRDSESTASASRRSGGAASVYRSCSTRSSACLSVSSFNAAARSADRCTAPIVLKASVETTPESRICAKARSRASRSTRICSFSTFMLKKLDITGSRVSARPGVTGARSFGKVIVCTLKFSSSVSALWRFCAE